MSKKRIREEAPGLVSSSKRHKENVKSTKASLSAVANTAKEVDEVDRTDLRSLGRLKTLDTIQSLDDQLSVATALCDHAHRADMLVRWLLPKMQAHTTYRTSHAAWHLFDRCIFFIKTPTLVVRLKGSHVLDIISQALSEIVDIQQLRQILASMNAVIRSLTSRTDLAGGTTSQRILDAPVSTAAGLVARWSRAVIRINYAAPEADHDLLSTTLRIWDLRRSTSEDEDSAQFIEHAWIPVSLLLASMKKQLSSKTTHKQIGAHSITQNCANLEKLIVKHVFWRSRATFLRLQAQDDTGTRPEAHLLDQVKVFVDVVKQSEDKALASSIFPLSLNIAVRCGPLKTQRQALREVSWYDAVFDALSAQLDSLFEAQLVDQTILDMLAIMQARPRLSTNRLQALIKARLAKSTSLLMKRELLYRIVSIDARTFCEASIFPTLSQGTVIVGEPSSRLAELKDRLIRPVMQAFARDRRLLEFLQLWQREIERCDESSADSIWIHMDSILEGVLEKHLTVQQVVLDVKERCNQLSTLAEVGSEEGKSHFSSALVILAAMLRAITNPETQQQVSVVLAEILDAFSRADVISSSREMHGYWNTMLQLLNICLPITMQDVDFNAKGMLLGTLPDQALLTIASNKSTSVRLCAALLLGRLCEIAIAEDDCQDACRDYLRRASIASRYITKLMLVRHPTLFSLLDPETSRHLASISNSTIDSGDEDMLTSFELLDSLYEAASLTPQGNEFVRALATHVDHIIEQSAGTPAHVELQVHCLDLIIRNPGLQVGRTEKIGEMIKGSLVVDDQKIFERRQALLQQLLGMKQSLRHISIDEMDIHALTDKIADHGRAGLSFQPELVTLGNITTRVVRSWLAGDDAKAAVLRTAKLIDLMATAVTKAGSGNEPWTASVHLCVLAAAFRSLQTLAPKVSQICQIACGSLLDFIAAVEVALAKTDAVPAEGDRVMAKLNAALSSALEATLALVTGVSKIALDATQLGDIQRLAATIMTKTTPRGFNDAVAINPSARAQPAIRAYQLMCTSDETDIMLLAHAAARLLQAPFSHIEHASVQKAYSQMLDGRDANQRLTVFQSLILRDEPITFSHLAIAELTLDGLLKTGISERVGDAISTVLHVVRSAAGLKTLQDTKMALDFIEHILCRNTTLVNQYLAEESIRLVNTLCRREDMLALLFPAMCGIITALLKHHRSRLADRNHIVLAALQAMLQALLKPTWESGRSSIQPPIRHAATFARLLELLCDPPQQRRQRNKDEAVDLVDHSRRLRARVGSFVSPLLHSYCSLILRSPPRMEVRDALRPGFASLMSAMEIYDADSMKILSSAMTDSERSVLRSIVEEWRAGGRWTGR